MPSSSSGSCGAGRCGGAWLLICGFLSIDVSFFVANLYKVLDGGYVPLLLGATMFIVMWTWSRGSRILLDKTHRDSIPIDDLIKMLEKSKPTRVPGTAIFLTSDPTVTPSSFMHSTIRRRRNDITTYCCAEPEQPRGEDRDDGNEREHADQRYPEQAACGPGHGPPVAGIDVRDQGGHQQ